MILTRERRVDMSSCTGTAESVARVALVTLTSVAAESVNTVRVGVTFTATPSTLVHVCSQTHIIHD